jgi:hypothetical protein
MARLVGRCPWCARTLEVEMAILGIGRWIAEERARAPGRPPLPGGAVPAKERVRAYRERKRVARERGEV